MNNVKSIKINPKDYQKYCYTHINMLFLEECAAVTDLYPIFEGVYSLIISIGSIITRNLLIINMTELFFGKLKTGCNIKSIL